MHFTYKALEQDADLQQGDILQRSEALTSVLNAVFPYYLHEDYRHFAVLTQPCDLVRGRQSRYITIGAVRPLSHAIEREAQRFQTNYVLRRANVVPDGAKDKLRQFLQRLLNNNEQEFFYLHEDASIGSAQPSCVFLRLSIALLSDHYEVCRAARVVSLEPMFQAKLGWLVGNIFSRVGTEDWVPKAASLPQWQRLIDDILARNTVFMNDKKIEVVKKANPEATISNMQADDVRRLIQASAEHRKKADAIEAVINQLQSETALSPEDLSKVQRRLENDAVFSSCFK